MTSPLHCPKCGENTKLCIWTVNDSSGLAMVHEECESCHWYGPILEVTSDPFVMNFVKTFLSLEQ